MLSKIKHNAAVFAVFIVAFVLLSIVTQSIIGSFSQHSSVEFGDFSQFAQANQVVVYHSPQCPICGNLKQYLDKRGFTYTAKNIDDSVAFANEFDSLGFKSIPLIVTAKKVIIGFDKNEVDKLIHQP